MAASSLHKSRLHFAAASGLAIERHEDILSGSAAGFFCVHYFLDLRHLTEYHGVAVEHNYGRVRSRRKKCPGAYLSFIGWG